MKQILLCALGALLIYTSAAQWFACNFGETYLEYDYEDYC